MPQPMIERECLLVRPAVLATIAAQARASEPNEMVGLLGADGAGVVVAAVELARGTPHTVRAPAGLMAEVAAALVERGLSWAGTYHSHPRTPAYPTGADRLILRAGQVMVIVALRPAELRAFRLAPDGRGVVELAVRPVAEE